MAHFTKNGEKGICGKGAKDQLTTSVNEVTCGRCLMVIRSKSFTTTSELPALKVVPVEEIIDPEVIAVEELDLRLRGCVSLHFDLSRYEKTGVHTPAGNECVDNGDTLAKAFRGLELEEVYEAVYNAIVTFSSDGTPFIIGRGDKKRVISSINDLKSRFIGLNPGMQRMNLGNIARRLMSNGFKF